MHVYSLVPSAKRHSPDFTQLPPGHRTCSFISHLNSPGSIQPGCHFSAHGTLQTHKPTPSYTVVPGTYILLGRESARAGKVPCLGAHRRSIFSASGIEPAISRLYVANATTEPRHTSYIMPYMQVHCKLLFGTCQSDLTTSTDHLARSCINPRFRNPC